MRAFRSALALLSLLFVAALSRPATPASGADGTAMSSCLWCNHSGTGDGHEYGVSHGVAMDANMSPHGMVAGGCYPHHGYCQQTNAMRFSTLDRLVAIADAGDTDALESIVSEDADNSFVYDPVEGRLDVRGCSGQTIAVMWVKSSGADTR